MSNILELNDQLTLLESSKELAKLGLPQDSFFQWCKYAWPSSTSKPRWDLGDLIPGDAIILEQIAAYTSAEIGFYLPGHFMPAKTKLGDAWYFCTEELFGGVSVNIDVNESNEAEARAKVLISLVKSGAVLLTREVVNVKEEKGS